MEFIAYQKIPTETASYDLTQKEATQLYSKLTWVVLEKVHGANFSIYYDGTEVKFAKRTAFLHPHEWFYNYQQISGRLSQSMIQLYTHLQSINSDLKYVILYGELFGGYYPPNPETWSGAVKANRINSKNECLIPLESRAIQEGIYYSPTIDYIVFDICLITESNQRLWINYDQLMVYGQQFGFHYLRPLLTGPFTQAMNYDLNFDSKVAVDICQQPKLPKGSNQAEGVVIKPNNSAIMVTLKKNPNVRLHPLVKRKHPAFAEISSDFSLPELTPNNILSSMVNINRLNALKSKVGSFEYNLEMVLMLVDDIWTDYYEIYSHLPITDYTQTNTYLIGQVQQLIQHNMSH